jgi:hypothetical protein
MTNSSFGKYTDFRAGEGTLSSCSFHGLHGHSRSGHCNVRKAKIKLICQSCFHRAVSRSPLSQLLHTPSRYIFQKDPVWWHGYGIYPIPVVTQNQCNGNRAAPDRALWKLIIVEINCCIIHHASCIIHGRKHHYRWTLPHRPCLRECSELESTVGLCVSTL